MMCIPFYSNYKLYIPYRTTITYINYNVDVLEKENFNGVFEKVTTSQISYKTCYLDGC